MIEEFEFIKEEELDYETIPKNQSGHSLLEQSVSNYYLKKGYYVNIFNFNENGKPSLPKGHFETGVPDIFIWKDKEEGYFIEIKKASSWQGIQFHLNQIRWYQKWKNLRVKIAIVIPKKRIKHSDWKRDLKFLAKIGKVKT